MYFYWNDQILKIFFSRNERKPFLGRVMYSSERMVCPEAKTHACQTFKEPGFLLDTF